MTSPGDEEAHFLSFFCFSGLSFERCIGISSWRRHGGRRLSASASNVISPSPVLSKGLSTLCSPFIPTQPPLFLSILTTLAPCSIHKPWDDKCPPPPASMQARIRQCHTALLNIIHLVSHQSGTQKMKCCCSSPFSQKGSPTFLLLCPFFLTAWFLHATCEEYGTFFCALMSTPCLMVLWWAVFFYLQSNKESAWLKTDTFQFTPESLVVNMN